MQTYILLTCNPGHEKEIITLLKSMDFTLEVNGIWGKYDIFLKVRHDLESGLDTIIDTLRNVENITSTYTMPILFGQGGSIDD